MAIQTEPLAADEASTLGRLPVGAALASVQGLLDRLDDDRSRLDARSRLDYARVARQVAGRLEALAGLLIAEADAAQASQVAAGTPMSSWLALSQNLSKRESAGLLHRARELAQHPAVGEAAVAGQINPGQARAISGVLDQIGESLDPGQRSEAERLLVDLADRLDSDRLAKAGPQVLAVVVPRQSAELVAEQLQREAEAAHRNRSLVLVRDGHGSVRFNGSLPRTEAEAWLTLLDAHAESQRRTAAEERDPLAEPLTPQQRRADALIAMIHTHQQQRLAPNTAGDRPRIVVTLDYAALLRDAAAAGLIAEGDPISAGELRRLCCDAELLPAVLGGRSEILDVGRAHRLVTPGMRAALGLRDGGCVFPGCHTRPNVCEAHHITPWWAGGPTALSNLALLCHHHHAVVEPARYSTRDQWGIRIAEDGVPEAIPPRRFDQDRKPIRHRRFEPVYEPAEPDHPPVEPAETLDEPAEPPDTLVEPVETTLTGPVKDGPGAGKAPPARSPSVEGSSPLADPVRRPAWAANPLAREAVHHRQRALGRRPTSAAVRPRGRVDPP